MSDDVWGHLRSHAAERRAAGLRRSLVPRGPDSRAVDLSSNDYLSLTGDPRVVSAAVAAAGEWGAGATGSRLVTGSTTLHEDLEWALANHTGLQSALVFSSGYTANLGVVTALSDQDTLVISDAHNHASLIDACRLSRAEIQVVPHRDLAAIERCLVERAQPRALVVTESIFSVDGDAADLIALQQLVTANGAALVVDEAHSLGVVGPRGCGSVAAAGLAQESNVVVTATLSKSLASQGGAVLGSQDVVDHVTDTARSFIFDTALAPPSAAAALAALDVLGEEPKRPERVRQAAQKINTTALANGWQSPRPDAAVISLLVGDPEPAVAEQRRWAEAGLSVGVFRPPSVPDGVSRLRLTAHAGLTEAEFGQVSAMLARGPAVPIADDAAAVRHDATGGGAQ